MKIRVAVLIVLLVTTTAMAGEKTTAQALVAPDRMEGIADQLIKKGIRPETAESAVQTMMQAGFTEEQMTLVTGMVPAGNDQFPDAEPILAKIHEGAAKGATPAAILTAVERVRNRYQLSARLTAELGQPGDRQIVTSLADCLAAGLSGHEAEEISAALRTRNRTMNEGESRALTIQTVLTARTMVRQGVSSATATQVLTDALAHGYDSQRMIALRQALDRSGSGSLENTARRFGAAIRQGAQAGELQDRPDSSRESSSHTGNKGGDSDTGGTGNENGGSGESGNGNDSGDSGSGSSGGHGGTGSGNGKGNDGGNDKGNGGRF
jgi:hypothetical protein